MMNRLLTLLATCLLIAGCKSTKNPAGYETVLDESEIHAALMNAKPPQQFGFAVYPSGNGIAMHGTARLHPRHMASVNFIADDYPVIKMTGMAPRTKMNALIDPASAESWMEYGKAKEFKAVFFGLDGRNIPYHGPTYIGQAPAYAAVVSQMRIDQLFIENSPMFIRMAVGSLGPLARGIQDPKISGLIGYDILQNFEYIQFDLANGKISFSATIPYTPSDALLVGAANIVPIPGIGLAINGALSGQETPIILDFAGSYNFARSDANVNNTKQVSLGEVVCLNAPTIQGNTNDGLPRAGMMLLGKYTVTICPRAGVVYFERPTR